MSGHRFEVFHRRPPLTGEPVLTITSQGTMSLNQAARDLLGNPEAVVLMYAREERLVGLRPASPGDPDAYKVVEFGRTRSDKRAGSIIAKPFCEWIGAEMGRARRYLLTMEDGVGIADLREPVEETQ